MFPSRRDLIESIHIVSRDEAMIAQMLYVYNHCDNDLFGVMINNYYYYGYDGGNFVIFLIITTCSHPCLAIMIV